MTNRRDPSSSTRTPRHLIEAAQHGDAAAQEDLFRSYEPLVQPSVWKLRLPPGIEREDLAQEARIGLPAAIRAWSFVLLGVGAGRGWTADQEWSLRGITGISRLEGRSAAQRMVALPLGLGW